MLNDKNHMPGLYTPNQVYRTVIKTTAKEPSDAGGRFEMSCNITVLA